jgi:putative ABC transport system permease protein
VSAVLVRARAELRARLPSMLALTILLGLGAGAVMTLTAGARRTDSAYARFAREYKAADMLLYPQFGDTFAKFDFATVAAQPQVLVAARQSFLGAQEQNIQVLAGDPPLGTEINRMKVLEGRLPRPDSTDEAVVSFDFAKARHLRPGSVMTIRFGLLDSTFVPMRLRIVGIEASPGEFPPQLSSNTPGTSGNLHIGRKAYELLKQRNVFTLDFLLLRLRRGSADFTAMNAALNRLAGGKPQLNQNLGAQAANVQRSIHLQAVALRIVGGLVGLIGLLVLSQLIARQAALDARETPTLLALGMTRRQIFSSGLGRYSLIGIAGGLIGVASAFAASPLMPIGTGRIAEPNPGLSFDALILGLGAVGTIVVILALAARPLWKSTKRSVEAAVAPADPSLVARTAAAPGFSPAVSTGIRLALETGRGPTAVPVRSSLLSVTLAIAALAGALTFGAGLDHLLKTPLQYGWNWDVHATSTNDEPQAASAMKVLDADPAVEAAALVDNPPINIGETRFDAISIKQHKGVIGPRILDGRAPRAANEVALGVKTMRDAHVRIGSTVHMQISAIAGGGASFKVVGSVVIPPNSDTARLGSGGVITYDGELAMVPKDFKDLPPISEIYFKFAPGVDRKAALKKIEPVLSKDYEIILPSKPSDLVNFGQVQNLPLLLAGLVAVMAAATLAHTLVTAIRRRRRDLAILKMLGFAPGQVRWTVACQATTFVSAALVIGLPVGLAAGRLAWTAVARQLGTAPEPVTPSVQLLLTIPWAVLFANLIAAIPGVMAGRMRPAPALRAE